MNKKEIIILAGVIGVVAVGYFVFRGAGKYPVVHIVKVDWLKDTAQVESGGRLFNITPAQRLSLPDGFNIGFTYSFRQDRGKMAPTGIALMRGEVIYQELANYI